eukprot:TRINITY_DN44332_c0_g1_i1.p1 TRINITY_DN44332_c0_g1~~TRINITY_DN44332_c0_g1_i1.p1  ORF type:complete len:182 (-),score=19.41 TRINITY_DN44332_c0_g1_i1:87-632(-)
MCIRDRNMGCHQVKEKNVCGGHSASRHAPRCNGQQKHFERGTLVQVKIPVSAGYKGRVHLQDSINVCVAYPIPLVSENRCEITVEIDGRAGAVTVCSHCLGSLVAQDSDYDAGEDEPGGEEADKEPPSIRRQACSCHEGNLEIVLPDFENLTSSTTTFRIIITKKKKKKKKKKNSMLKPVF